MLVRVGLLCLEPLMRVLILSVVMKRIKRVRKCLRKHNHKKGTDIKNMCMNKKGTHIIKLLLMQAISRRATLQEIIRDYKQAANDLQRLISLLENQLQAKPRQHNSRGKSSGGGSIRDLRKARRDISLMEDKAKKEVPLDLYLILGIKASDTESDIKKAYRKAALRHHPDKAGQVLVRSDVGKEVGEKIHNDSDRLFKVIGEAYAVLSDPSKRSKYDNEEEMRSASCSSYSNGNSSGRPSTSYSSSPYGKGNSYGRQSGYGTERKSKRWHWYDAKPYDSHYH